MPPIKTKPVREWITPPMIAAEVGGHPETVIGWIRSGELPAVDFSRRGSLKPRFRVKREDFDAFLRRRSVVAPSKPAPRRKATEQVTQYV